MPTKTATKLLPLTIDQYARERCFPVDFLVKTWGLTSVKDSHGVTCIEQPYMKRDGAVGDPRYRYANGKRSPEGAKLILYGQKQLVTDQSGYCALEGRYCFLVEGESDTQTLQFLRYNVLGIPGTQTWNTCLKNDPAILPFFERWTPVIIQEPPSGAEKKKHIDSPAKLVEDIKASLPLTPVIVVRLWEFAPKDEDGEPAYKDISGMWTYHGGVNGIKFFNQSLRAALRFANKSAQISPRKIDLICADDVEPKLTRWLWDLRIALNKVCVFSGMAERGKSTVATDFIARLTTGRNFPDSENVNDPCDVVVLASEEDYDEDIVPRLMGARANLKRVKFAEMSTVDGDDPWTIALDRDLNLFREMLAANPNVKLLVVDPVTSYIGDVDPNKPKEVRPFIDKLKKFAKEMNVTVLLIMHFSKNPDVSALHRSGGAATWTDAPRSVWLFDKKKGEEDDTVPRTHVMVPGKGNKVAADKKKTLEFTFKGVDVRIEGEDIAVGAIEWGNETDLTLDQQFKDDDDDRKKPGPRAMKTEQAMEWIREQLKDGPQPSSEMIARGKEEGYSKDLLNTAKNRLKVRSMQLATGWQWLID